MVMKCLPYWPSLLAVLFVVNACECRMGLRSKRQSGGSPQGNVEIPALGRSFKLGDLYNYRSDQIIPGISLWNRETIDRYAYSVSTAHTRSEFLLQHTTRDRLDALGVRAELRLSLLSGLFEVAGSGEYAKREMESQSTVRVVLSYEATTVHETLVMEQLGNIEYPDVFDTVPAATHLVTGITYGARALLTFDDHRSVESSEERLQASAALQGVISALTVEGSGEVNRDETFNDTYRRLSVSFDGDFAQPPLTNVDEAVAFYRGIDISQSKGVPVTVFLSPLSQLDSTASKILRSIGHRLLASVEGILVVFEEVLAESNDIKIQAPLDNIKDTLGVFHSLVASFRTDLSGQISQILPQVRGGEMDDAALARLVTDTDRSPYAERYLTLWLRLINARVQFIRNSLMSLGDVQVHQTVHDLAPVVFDFDRPPLFVLELHGLAGSDVFLDALTEYYQQAEKQTATGELLADMAAALAINGQLYRAIRVFAEYVKLNQRKCLFAITTVDDQESSDVAAHGVIKLYRRGAFTSIEPLNITLVVSGDTLSWTSTPNVPIAQLRHYVGRYRPAVNTNLSSAAVDTFEWGTFDIDPQVATYSVPDILGLTAGVRYRVQLLALTVEGFYLGVSNEVDVVGTNAHVSAVPVIDEVRRESGVRVRWSYTDNPGLDHYLVQYRMQGAHDWSSVQTCRPQDRTTTVPPPRSRKSISVIRVAAVDKQGRTSAYSEPRAVCPSGWQTWRSSCYYVGPLKKFDDAEAHCVSKGAHLASIQSSEENEFIVNNIVNSGATHYYIGVNDRGQECGSNGACAGWVHTDGRPVSWTNWNRGEPNQPAGRQEDCVVMARSAGYRWADVICTRTHPFVCELS